MIMFQLWKNRSPGQQLPHSCCLQGYESSGSQMSFLMDYLTEILPENKPDNTLQIHLPSNNVLGALQNTGLDGLSIACF